MNNDKIKFLLVRYITGQATAEEAKRVKHWVSMHPENEQYFVELYDLWQNMLQTRPDVIDEEAAYQRLSARIHPKPPKRKWPALITTVVALVAIAAGLLFVLNKDKSIDKQIVSLVSRKGSIKKLQLSDGTLVWLNAGSRLSYSANFGKTDRAIHLEGEAFFDIAPGKKELPFSVSTSRFVIHDIGTKFNVKAYPNDSFFEATVVKGEVSVENKAAANTRDVNRMYLKPSQVLKIYYKHDGNGKPGHSVESPVGKMYNEMQVMQVKPEQLSVYDGWKDDLLVFDAASLDQIFRVLERRYDVQIALKDSSLRQIQYTGSFKNIPDVAQVLNVIKANTPITYTIADRHITVAVNHQHKN